MAMLLTSKVTVDQDKDTSVIKPSEDAHRSFCDVLEDEVVDPAASIGPLGLEHVERLLPPSCGGTAAVRGANAAAAAASAAALHVSFTGKPAPITSADTFYTAAARVRQGLVGRNAPFRTPYGSKPLVYSDWTATGRAVACIERYLYNEVVALFGNTHTTTSITGAQTTCFRHEARQIIAQAVNAKVRAVRWGRCGGGFDSSEVQQ